MAIAKQDNLHVCLKCGYKTNRSSSVLSHYRMKHMPQVPASCQVCHKVLKNAYYRNMHLRKVHGLTRDMLDTE